MPDRTNAIVDLSHHNTITSLDQLKQDGVIAIIHKATEGTVFVDKTYKTRRTDAKAAGFLWGSYHFVSGEPVDHQVEHYLDTAQPAADELMAVDYEPSSAGMPNMTLSQLEAFVTEIKAKMGRFPVVYGGHLLRDVLGSTKNATLAQCPLWYARYAASPIEVPNTWAGPTIWQYTDGKFGNDPKTVKGVSGEVDRDIYFGSPNDLKTRWPLT